MSMICFCRNIFLKLAVIVYETFMYESIFVRLFSPYLVIGFNDYFYANFSQGKRVASVCRSWLVFFPKRQENYPPSLCSY